MTGVPGRSAWDFGIGPGTCSVQPMLRSWPSDPAWSRLGKARPCRQFDPGDHSIQGHPFVIGQSTAANTSDETSGPPTDFALTFQQASRRWGTERTERSHMSDALVHAQTPLDTLSGIPSPPCLTPSQQNYTSLLIHGFVKMNMSRAFCPLADGRPQDGDDALNVARTQVARLSRRHQAQYHKAIKTSIRSSNVEAPTRSSPVPIGCIWQPGQFEASIQILGATISPSREEKSRCGLPLPWDSQPRSS
ncbi:hypothetical protein K456DRAFT_1757297 [Colletotrichum gloeosporioides 23]|nr:hypothetical protein K456DRAFT_1757297 [Colletotrichum gloeosporioides 23]